MNQTVNRIWELVDRLEPILAGHAPEVQGGAIADLCATYVAGFIITKDADGMTAAESTRQLRQSILQLHVDLVRELIPVAEKRMADLARQGRIRISELNR